MSKKTLDFLNWLLDGVKLCMRRRQPNPTVDPREVHRFDSLSLRLFVDVYGECNATNAAVRSRLSPWPGNCARWGKN